MKRRRFLQRASAAGAGAAMGSVYTLLTEGAARCDPADDYKALVCVFLQGGLDNHDTLLPYDAPSYAEFSRIRRDLLRTYETPRSQDALLPLTTEAGQFGGRQFGLPPEMTGLKSLYDGGQAAIIANVGPLIEPVTRRSYEDRTARLPSRLFSHNDQQSTWMAGAPEGAQYGWAGLFADAMRDRNGAPEFSAITGGGNDLFVTGERTAPYQVPPSGAIEVEWVRQQEGPLQAVLREHLRSLPSSDRSLLEQDLGRAGRQAFDANARFNQASGDAPEFRTEFPESGIGGQLRAVSQSIAARRSLSVGRQVFVVGMGGYDTHSSQARNLPSLQARLDAGILAFSRAMEELGLSQQVTLFTASDFGRTLAVNDDGTDHGWGGHHFVVGGAVRGGKVFGDLPEVALGHSLDAGNGRLIPTLAVEQMAAPLGRWFGLDETRLNRALPRLGQFTSPLPAFLAG